MAIALAEAGADVVCASSKPGGADETAKCVESLGRKAWTVSADLADRRAVLRMAEDAQREAGVIDILVNNGGTIARQPAVDYAEPEWDRITSTNLDSVWFLSQFFGRGMVERRSGKIVNIASVLSFSGGITVPAYTASKHAITGLTKAISLDGRAFNIACGQIDIGNTATDMTSSMSSGSLQADGSMKAEPTFNVQHVVDALLYMANLPLEANVQFMTVMATTMPYIGRG